MIDPGLAIMSRRPTLIATDRGCGKLCDDPELEQLLVQLLYPPGGQPTPQEGADLGGASIQGFTERFHRRAEAGQARFQPI